MGTMNQFLNKQLQEVGGAEESRGLVERIEQANLKHNTARATAEKYGRELGELMGKQASLACKHAVLHSMAQQKKSTAQELNLQAEQVRRGSQEATQAAVDAADRRWRIKKACRSSVITENTTEQAKARADKFRAYAQQIAGDLSNAEDKATRA